ncbi:MAG: amino acid adenylation domain-containing protein [Gammaproteobacteria bacterium]
MKDPVFVTQTLGENVHLRQNFTSPFCMHELFERQAARRPDATAVLYDKGSISYAEINAQANRLARLLRKRGVGSNTPVGLAIDRSPEMIIALLGILKSGGAYVPLDPDLPHDRLKFMAGDAGLEFLVSVGDRCHMLDDFRCPILLDRDSRRLNQEPDSNPDFPCRSDDLMYVIYTSGSTGRPKGVMVTHRNVSRLFPATSRHLDFSERDVWSQIHTLSFGFSVWEIWGALVHGAKLAIVPQSATRTPELLLELIDTLSVSILSITPSAFKLLDWADALRGSDCSSLKYVIFSGEAPEAKNLRSWIARRGDLKPEMINMYAATETAGEVAMKRILKQDATPENAANIGMPLEDVSFHLLDRNLRPVEDGKPGDLHIAGRCVALGYLHHSELNAERFLKDPFSDDPDSRLYKTGDLAMRLTNGEYVFLGRSDNQIKVRGYRIEPGDIKHAIDRHPSVKDSQVLAERDDKGNVRLIAYVVPHAPIVRPGGQNQHDETLFWPSLGEFNLYDDLVYSIMSGESHKQVGFRKLIEKSVEGKTVIDAGTGKDALWAKFAVACGAKKVYTVELLEKAARQARKAVEKDRLSDRIEVINGDLRTVELPEKADVLLSRIYGNIASQDGVVPIINQAKRLLHESASIIPGRCLTYIVPISLPEALRRSPRFARPALDYVDQAFQWAGRPFDLRLCVQNFPKDRLLSQPAVFEDLDFSRPLACEYDGSHRFKILKIDRVDGFLLWVRLYEGNESIADYLDEQQGWLPVFLPVFGDSLDIGEGDEIWVEWTCAMSDNKLNPDYFLSGQVYRSDREPLKFEYASRYMESGYKRNPFYRRLFHEMRREADPVLLDRDIRRSLARELPAYMMPDAIVWLESFPLSPSGKLDLDALPRFTALRHRPDSPFHPPTTPVEKKLADIWLDILDIDHVGLQDHFVELGGHSLLAMQIVNRIIEEFKIDFSILQLFENPTIAQIALYIVATRAELADKYEVETMLDSLAQLSDEEAGQILLNNSASDIRILTGQTSRNRKS